MFDSNQFFSGGAAGFYPKTIEQSLRFNDNDSAYLSRTPASAGNRKTWTWSGWVKYTNLGSAMVLLNAGADNNNRTYINLQTDDTISIGNSSGGTYTVFRTTTQVFRDPSAWYHFVIAFDTTQATGANRVKLYVNGEQITSFSTSNDPTQNAEFNASNTVLHTINANSSLTSFFSGYLAEVHFTDGTAYDADAFGELKSGVWVAKSPSVTYGTNGFYLDFANSADIGNDVSGEGNDWTPNNFTASDVVLDSPTDNFATLNAVDNASGATLSNGNLETTSAAANYKSNFGTIFVSSGKWYAEFTVLAGSNDSRMIAGVGTKQTSVTTQLGNDTYSYSINYDSGNSSIFKRTNNSNTILTSTGNLTNGSVIMVALDLDNNKLWFGQDGTWYDSGAPESGTNEIFNITGSREYTFMPCTFSDGKLATNFGQLGFTYTPPTGYLALSTANLPDPAIDPAQGSSPEDYFGVLTYDGSGSTQTVTGLDFEPDFVWIKSRSNATSNYLHDSVRGDTKYLFSNEPDAEDDWDGTGNGMVQFVDGGFELSGGSGIDGSTRTYVAWNWKSGGAPTTDNVGGQTPTSGSVYIDGVASTASLPSSNVYPTRLSANTEAGFSIITYEGNGGTNQTMPHGLNQAPELYFGHSRDSSRFWGVITTVGVNPVGYLKLEQTDSEVSSSTTAPTSDHIYLNGTVLNSAESNVIYCFHSVEGFSKFGSYTGNGSADGTFVYTGFRPAWIMWKRTDSSTGGEWVIQDTTRREFNPVNVSLYPNLSNAEATGETFRVQDTLSNGFKLRSSAAQCNASGGTYIYMAFSANPFKFSTAF